MNSISYSAVLLAEKTFRGFGDGLRGDGASLDSSDIFVGIVILVLAVVGIAVLQRLVARQDSSRRYNSPRALFGELCKAHELDRKERAFLKRVAAYQRLKQPALIFVEPDRLKPARLSRQQRTQLPLAKSLYKRLFADLLTATAPAEEIPQTKPSTTPAGRVVDAQTELRPVDS